MIDLLHEREKHCSMADDDATTNLLQ